MGMDDIGALGSEWDMEAHGDIPASPNDAVVQSAVLNDMNSEKLGVGAADVERVTGQIPVAVDIGPVDDSIIHGTYLPEELLDKIADAAQEVAAFLEANPQKAAPAPVYDYGEDFAPV